MQHRLPPKSADRPGGPAGCDGPAAAILARAGDLPAQLPAWAARDDTRPDAPARRAANNAVDAMLAGLHAVRARLVSEIRAADAARVDSPSGIVVGGLLTVGSAP